MTQVKNMSFAAFKSPQNITEGWMFSDCKLRCTQLTYILHACLVALYDFLVPFKGNKSSAKQRCNQDVGFLPCHVSVNGRVIVTDRPALLFFWWIDDGDETRRNEIDWTKSCVGFKLSPINAFKVFTTFSSVFSQIQQQSDWSKTVMTSCITHVTSCKATYYFVLSKHQRDQQRMCHHLMGTGA